MSQPDPNNFEKLWNSSVEKLKELPELFLKYGADTAETDFKDLENLMDVYSNIKQERTISSDALAGLKTELCGQQDLNSDLNLLLDDYKIKAAAKHAKSVNALNKKFKKQLTSLLKESMDKSMEIEVVEENITHYDPWTKRSIKNPIKSSSCGHIYDASSIKFVTGKQKLRCPYTGCQQMINEEDFFQHI